MGILLNTIESTYGTGVFVTPWIALPSATDRIPNSGLCVACFPLRILGVSQKEGIQMANKSLYVGNMSYSTTESTVRSLFEPYGPIAEVRIIGDKGFGFVEIPEENMQAAIDAVNGKEVDGRTLTVNEARPKTDRPRGGGGFGGGRGGSGGGRGGFGGGGGSRRW
jgi:uncharacterized membrane protein YgcG